MLNFALLFGVLTISGFIFRALWRALITPVNKYFVVHDTPTGLLQVSWLLLEDKTRNGILCTLRHSRFRTMLCLWWIKNAVALFLCRNPKVNFGVESGNR